MNLSLYGKVVLFVFGLLLAVPYGAAADETALTNIVVTNNRQDLLLYLNATGAFSEKTQKAILSGVPTTFSFFIKLNKKRSYWMDKTIADVTVTHVIKFDSLKKLFYVTRSWDPGEVAVVDSFEEAQQLMIRIDSVKLMALEKLEKGAQYQIRAKAELDKVTLPLHLHRVFFFLSAWDTETDWYAIDFTY